MRLEARAEYSRTLLVASPFVAIVFTLVVAAAFVAWAGAPVGRTYALIFEGGFGSRFAWSETLTRATPLMLTGLAATIAFRAHLYNIGAEGQLYAGALAAVAVGGLHGGAALDLPAPVLFAAMIAAAMIAGAILMALPAFAKTRFGVDEVVTTLLLNFIVLLFVSMMLDGPMKDPTAMGWPQSVALDEAVELPKLVERTRVHAGLLVAIALCVLAWAAMLAGALLLIVPALLRTRLGVDEVVTTLLLNFIVLLFVSMMLDGPMKDPAAMGWPQSVALQEELQLPKLIERTRVHTGLLWAVGLSMLLWLVLKYSTFGFAVRAVGANARGAAFAGVPVTRTVIVVALVSGALAGLAGAIEVAGRTTYVTLDMSPGYGYAGIVIAMLAGLNPLGIVAAAIFVAGVLVGADSMSRGVAVPTYIAEVIVAISLLSMLVATAFARYRLRWN